MSTKYKFRDQEKLYFISFAVVYWLDVFIRNACARWGGWIVGGVYLGADLLTKYVSGKSIGDHLNNYVEEKFDKDGGALVKWK